MRLRTGAVIIVLLAAGGAQAAKDSCFDCHSVMEGMSIPFENDIHYKNGLSCAACHGGDPTSDDQNISMSAERGFKVRVTRDAVGEYCARCHSDAALIHKYSPQQPVDQLALYGTGVHATKPAGSDSVGATCGKCHQDSAGAFGKSTHAAIFTTKEMPSCATCHASHATQRAGTEMLAGGHAVCARCHEPDTKGGKTAAAMERAFDQVMMAMFDLPPGRGATGAAAAGEPSARQIGQMMAAFNLRIKKARSTVHSLDAAAVKAAAEAAVSDQH
jgi:hypothetical protein